MTSPCLRIVPLEPGDVDVSGHRLYAGKCGFRKVREHDDPDGVGSVFVFEKSY